MLVEVLFCEIDGRVLGHAVWGAGWVLGGMRAGACAV